jgi:hypothetical protein
MAFESANHMAILEIIMPTSLKSWLLHAPRMTEVLSRNWYHEAKVLSVHVSAFSLY